MKTAMPFFCFFLVLLSAGCQKNDSQPGTGVTFISAYKNAESWISNEPYASVSKKDKTIWIGGYEKNKNPGGNDEFLIMHLEIADLSDLKNTVIKDVNYESILGGDLVTDRYIIDTANINNEIEITEIDETKKIMKGQFNLNLVRDAWFSTNGEKIQLKSGQFVVSYTEE